MNLNDLASGLSFLAPVETPDISSDLLTRTLENNLTALESLRDQIDRRGLKFDVGDVREFGYTVAGELLGGYETIVTYDDLLRLIGTYKKGLAGRYLAA